MHIIKEIVRRVLTMSIWSPRIYIYLRVTHLTNIWGGLCIRWASPRAQLVKYPPAMWETWVQPLEWADPLEKGKATHSSVLDWRIQGLLQSMGSQKVRHNWATFTSLVLKKQKLSHSVLFNSLQPHGLQPTRLLRPWDFPDKSTGVGCSFLLQRIFPTKGLNPGLLHFKQTLYHLSHQGNCHLC